MPSRTKRPSMRTRVAVTAGSLAGWASRTLGRGAGATLPGRITLAIAPGALADLSAGRTVTMVTGTNGKTTTTAFLVAALTTGEQTGSGSGVVTNTTGANLPTGVVTALAGADANASTAVLETDELHVPAVMTPTAPRVLVLLNLSRDQLDRTHEVRRAVGLWRDAIAGASAPLTVIANAADPNVAFAALAGAEGRDGAVDLVWVDGGLSWLGDAELCPRCDALLDDVTSGSIGWSCTSCGLRQPVADVSVVDGRVRLTDGSVLDVRPALPGTANLSNAAFAIAAAQVLGVDPVVAAERLAVVDDVAGRYASRPMGGADRPVRMLLAKNPAGWTVALDLIEPDAVIALGVNARTQDGTDTSWLWDVPFEVLAGRTVGVFGERAPDLDLRLRHAGVDTVRAPGTSNVGDAHALADTLPDGPMTMLATYTTFQEVRRGL